MARCTEVVRQWEILRAIDAVRHGIGIAKLAAELGVHTRTIRRDLDALGRAGFPLFDEKVNGTSMWKLKERPFRGLESMGLSLMELCALYFSRTMLCALAGTPLLDDAERGFAKIERALPTGCRRFLDELPRMMKAKPRGRKKHDERRLREVLGRAFDATLRHRRGAMRYASASSQRTKEYLVEPQRIVYADGGIYLVAWVPAYGGMRTFAAERIETFAVTDEIFTPRPLPAEPFADSMGVNTGPPEKIVLEFEPGAAAFVREREWHPSQVIADGEDNRVVVTLDVCVDYALRAWILSFGPDVRVVSPARLADTICEAANRTRQRYPPARVEPRFSMLRMREAG
ncbi:MAG: WYL domain-containing transcriptional regulator [Acidobacteria bacterium]|nr:WYL domain-containing transcriptional regulator [Acidobacteriota bacterium]